MQFDTVKEQRDFVYRMNLTNSGTEISPHHLWCDSTASTILIISPIANLVLSTTCLIVLNTYMKRLHETFKKLLNIVMVHNLIAEVALISLNIFMSAFRSQEFIICTLRAVFGGSNAYFTFYSIAMLSFLRYRIAWKINNLESTKKKFWWMMGPLILYGIVEFLITIPMILILNIFFDMPSYSTLCAGAKLEETFPIIPYLNMLKVLFSISLGIRYDILMIDFLKKKNTHPEPGQAKLVPWKSGEDNYDFMVPTTATLTAAISGVAGLIISSTLTKGIIDNQLESWKVTETLFSVLVGIQMPILIGLSIRAARHKKPAPVIPRGLLFHEDINVDIKNQGEEIQMAVPHLINIQDQDEHISLSSHESISPKPKVIYVKPCSESANVEYHI